jgi:hypothetical protein
MQPHDYKTLVTFSLPAYENKVFKIAISKAKRKFHSQLESIAQKQMCHLASPPQTDGSQSHYLEKMKKKPCFTGA